MAETKLEAMASAFKFPHSLCSCDNPSHTLHIAQAVFMKCEKCGRPVGRGFSHQEARKAQDDMICV